MAFRYGMAYSPMQWFSGYVIATTMPSVSNETPSTRWLSLCEFKGLIPRVTLCSPWALLCRAVGTGFRFISAFTDRLVLCAPSNFFKSVFQFSSIFCSVLAQTVDEPLFQLSWLSGRFLSDQAFLYLKCFFMLFHKYPITFQKHSFLRCWAKKFRFWKSAFVKYLQIELNCP